MHAWDGDAFILHAQVEQLVARLVKEEHYALAVFVCRRMEVDDRGCWIAWAKALVMCGLSARPTCLLLGGCMHVMDA